MLNLNLNRLAKAAAVAAMTLGVAVAATPAQKASAQVAGAGASSISPLVNPLLRQNGNIYSITGSGTGRQLLQDGVIDYASSDAGSIGASAPGVIDGQVAITAFDIGVAFPYNVPGFTAVLSVEQACGLINGDITNWSDVGGPDLPVRRVARGDSSGTTDTINRGFVNPFCGSNIPNPPSPDGSNLPNPNGNEIIVPPAGDPYSDGNQDNSDSYSFGVASAIQNNEGAVGYVDSAVAQTFGLPVAVEQVSGQSILAQGPNYFIFRNFYPDESKANAARDLCNSIVSQGVPDGYLPPSGSSDSCDAIGGP